MKNCLNWHCRKSNFFNINFMPNEKSATYSHWIKNQWMDQYNKDPEKAFVLLRDRMLDELNADDAFELWDVINRLDVGRDESLKELRQEVLDGLQEVQKKEQREAVGEAEARVAEEQTKEAARKEVVRQKQEQARAEAGKEATRLGVKPVGEREPITESISAKDIKKGERTVAPETQVSGLSTEEEWGRVFAEQEKRKPEPARKEKGGRGWWPLGERR